MSSPPTVGTPTEFPYPEMPPTTRSSSQRFFGSSSGPKLNGSMSAMGLAPMVKMSRIIPPTPVAAPW